MYSNSTQHNPTEKSTVTKLDTKFPTCMEPKCSLQYSQQPTNGKYTDTTLQFSPIPNNYDYSLHLTYPQSSHKGKRYTSWNDSLFKTDSRKYKFYWIIFTMLFTTTDRPNISASEHITSTHPIISMTQYTNERYFFVCISVCQVC
jgi:hypothetical protein